MVEVIFGSGPEFVTSREAFLSGFLTHVQKTYVPVLESITEYVVKCQVV